MQDPIGLISSGALATLIVTALWRGWVIPRPTMERERALQNQVNDMRAEEAKVSRELVEKMRMDNVALTNQLTEAIRREYRSAGSPTGSPVGS